MLVKGRIDADSTKDGEVKARACFDLLQRLKRGDETASICEAVVTEVAYVLSSPRAPYRLSHEEIRAHLSPILELRGLNIPHKRVYQRALDVWVAYPFLDFEDAVIVAHVGERGTVEVLSYDSDFDPVSGITHAEP